MALSLEGLSRNAGKHAGGVVISPTVLTDFTPLYCEVDGDFPNHSTAMQTHEALFISHWSR